MRRSLGLLALLSILALGRTATAQVSAAGQTFPGLANYSIGGAHDYDNPAVIAHAALDDVYVLAAWNGWQAGRSRNMAQIVASIASQSVRGTKVISYFDAISTVNAFPAYVSQMNSASFLLRNPWPFGAVIQFSGASNVGNVYPGGPTGAGGRTYAQYAADYNVDWMFNGGAAGLATDGTDAVNSALAGAFEDDLYFKRPVGGDWGRTGQPGSGTDAQFRIGLLSILQRMKASKPGSLSFANLSQAQDPSNLPVPEFVGAFDGGLLENMVGNYGAIEQIGNDSSLAVLAYRNQMTLLNNSQLGIFEAHLTSNGQDTVDSTHPYQAMRHALAFCLVVGNARCALSSVDNSTSGDASLWFDELSVNITTRKPYTTPNASAAPGLGYLGTAVDPPQTGPIQNGYWRRRFQNGEVWWSPREAAAGNINFGRTVYFISGVQAPSFNNGASGTAHSISSRDGLVVLYQASAAQSTTSTTPPHPPSNIVVQ
jgi:hypothetical protein